MRLLAPPLGFLLLLASSESHKVQLVPEDCSQVARVRASSCTCSGETSLAHEAQSLKIHHDQLVVLLKTGFNITKRCITFLTLVA